MIIIAEVESISKIYARLKLYLYNWKERDKLFFIGWNYKTI